MPIDISISAGSIQRVAETMRGVDKAQAKAFAQAEASLPLSVRQQLKGAFTLRGLPFFEFYVQLRRIQAGEPVPGDIKPTFKRMMNRLIQLKSPVDKKTLSPIVVNQIADARTIINVMLTRLISGKTDDTMTWMKINHVIVPLITSVARDKGVYLNPIQKGVERWATFRRMSPKREKIERLRDDDPESYALMVQKGQLLEEIDAGIIERIQADGQSIVKRGKIMGRPVIIGKNRYTGEERIYDRDGDVLTHDEFFTKRKAAEEWREKGFRAPPRMEAPIEDIRLFDKEQVAQLEGEVEYDSITDDKAKQGRLTRIFATKRMPVMIAQQDGSVRIEKVKVIVNGRFKGVYLDDMINSQGRMIEGTEYKLEPMAGRTAQVPRKVDGEWVMVDVPGKTMKKVVRRDVGDREPYVTAADVKTTYMDPETKKAYTVKEEKLFLKVPGTREFTEIRNAAKALACNTGSKAGCIPSISYHPVKGSRAATFYFDPKDYGAIRDALQGMSLSKGANDLLSTYFSDLARAEQATAKENLGFYSAGALGGFKAVRKDRTTGEVSKFDLLTKQKQALAWMEAKGNNGVCALDTGVGKTLTTTAMMQKLRRDGFTDEDSSYQTPTGKTIKTNGRFLYVTPKDLKGNLPKEIRNFISEAGDLLEMVDVVSYNEFRRAVSGKPPGSVKNKRFWKQRAALPPSRLAATGLTDSQWTLLEDLHKAFPYGLEHRFTGRSEIRDARILVNLGLVDAGRADTRQKNRQWVITSQGQGLLKRGRQAASGKVWDIQLYVAIFFDEAQKLTLTKNGNVTSLAKPTLAFQAANIYHPRKIFLTASPMEKEPEQAYLLQSMSANEPLAGRSPEAERNRVKMRRHMNRFTERVGGRIVGVRQDPALKSEFQQWVKQAVFFADKRNVEEFTLPDKREETLTVTMHPMVEDAYKATALGFSKMMRAMALKMKERGGAAGDARDTEQDRAFFGRAMAPVMKLLNGLANYPDEALYALASLKQTGLMPNGKEIPKVLKLVLKNIPQDGAELEAIASQVRAAGNPKLKAVEAYLWATLSQTDGASRALIFAEDKKLCKLAAEHMAANIPGKHVLATNDMITIFGSNGEVPFVSFPMDWEAVLRTFRSNTERATQAWQENDGVSRLQVPFSKRVYRKHPELPAHRLYNIHYKADQWQQFVLKEVVNPDTSIRSCTLLGTEYQFGHNLQSFGRVVHLDRNSWNSESMKQRTARSWRQGQDQPVDVLTVDAVYAEREDHDDRDSTLDEIRRWFQEMEGELFDAIIKDAQGAELGTEWFEMSKKSASFMRVDRDVLELMTSPYVSRSK